MIAKYVNQPLGMGNPYSPTEKRWILSALSAVGGLASSIFGGVSAAKQAEEAEAKMRADRARENASFTRKANENYIDSAEGQNLVRRAKTMFDRGVKKTEGAAAVMGATSAEKQMAKDSANQAMGDTIANIAATDTARRDRASEIHEQNQQRFAQQDIALSNQRAQNITTAAQQASNALMSIGSAIEQGTMAKQSMIGGSNNSTTADKTVDYDAIRSNNQYYANMSDDDIAYHMQKIGRTSGY